MDPITGEVIQGIGNIYLVRDKFGEYLTDCQGTPTRFGTVLRQTGHAFKTVPGSQEAPEDGYLYGSELEKCCDCGAERVMYYRWVK